MKTSVKHIILNKLKAGKKLLAILIDPDKASEGFIQKITSNANDINADLFLVGGSLLTDGDLDKTIKQLKAKTEIPVIIFPGSTNQLSSSADAILFLSLLSSRNPEMLIGQQVIAAPYIKKLGLEPISTAYLLIDSGKQTTASYMSNSTPIPANKAEIAASTALAGDYMGMEFIYLDAGSGANHPVPTEMIEKVKSYTSNGLFVGGGINSPEKLEEAYHAGADIVVIGDAFEKQIDFANSIKTVLKKVNS